MSGEDAKQDRLLVGDPLPATLKPIELRRALGLSETKFWAMQKAGAFRHLEVIEGHRLYSGALVTKMLAEGASAVQPQSGRRFFKRGGR